MGGAQEFMALRCDGAETALARLNQSSLERVFAVNAFGPILVSKVCAWCLF